MANDEKRHKKKSTAVHVVDGLVSSESTKGLVYYDDSNEEEVVQIVVPKKKLTTTSDDEEDDSVKKGFHEQCSNNNNNDDEDDEDDEDDDSDGGVVINNGTNTTTTMVIEKTIDEDKEPTKTTMKKISSGNSFIMLADSNSCMTSTSSSVSSKLIISQPTDLNKKKTSAEAEATTTTTFDDVNNNDGAANTPPETINNVTIHPTRKKPSPPPPPPPPPQFLKSLSDLHQNIKDIRSTKKPPTIAQMRTVATNAAITAAAVAINAAAVSSVPHVCQKRQQQQKTVASLSSSSISCSSSDCSGDDYESRGSSSCGDDKETIEGIMTTNNTTTETGMVSTIDPYQRPPPPSSPSNFRGRYNNKSSSSSSNNNNNNKNNGTTRPHPSSSYSTPHPPPNTLTTNPLSQIFRLPHHHLPSTPPPPPPPPPPSSSFPPHHHHHQNRTIANISQTALIMASPSARPHMQKILSTLSPGEYVLLLGPGPMGVNLQQSHTAPSHSTTKNNNNSSHGGRSGGVYINYLVPNGQASKSNIVGIGDAILRVGDINVTNETIETVPGIIARAKRPVVIVLTRSFTGSSSSSGSCCSEVDVAVGMARKVRDGWYDRVCIAQLPFVDGDNSESRGSSSNSGSSNSESRRRSGGSSSSASSDTTEKRVMVKSYVRQNSLLTKLPRPSKEVKASLAAYAAHRNNEMASFAALSRAAATDPQFQSILRNAFISCCTDSRRLPFMASYFAGDDAYDETTTSTKTESHVVYHPSNSSNESVMSLSNAQQPSASTIRLMLYLEILSYEDMYDVTPPHRRLEHAHRIAYKFLINRPTTPSDETHAPLFDLTFSFPENVIQNLSTTLLSCSSQTAPPPRTLFSQIKSNVTFYLSTTRFPGFLISNDCTRMRAYLRGSPPHLRLSLMTLLNEVCSCSDDGGDGSSSRAAAARNVMVYHVMHLLCHERETSSSSATMTKEEADGDIISPTTTTTTGGPGGLTAVIYLRRDLQRVMRRVQHILQNNNDANDANDVDDIDEAYDDLLSGMEHLWEVYLAPGGGMLDSLAYLSNDCHDVLNDTRRLLVSAVTTTTTTTTDDDDDDSRYRRRHVIMANLTSHDMFHNLLRLSEELIFDYAVNERERFESHVFHEILCHEIHMAKQQQQQQQQQQRRQREQATITTSARRRCSEESSLLSSSSSSLSSSSLSFESSGDYDEEEEVDGVLTNIPILNHGCLSRLTRHSYLPGSVSMHRPPVKGSLHQDINNDISSRNKGSKGDSDKNDGEKTRPTMTTSTTKITVNDEIDDNNNMTLPLHYYNADYAVISGTNRHIAATATTPPPPPPSSSSSSGSTPPMIRLLSVPLYDNTTTTKSSSSSCHEQQQQQQSCSSYPPMITNSDQIPHTLERYTTISPSKRKELGDASGGWTNGGGWGNSSSISSSNGLSYDDGDDVFVRTSDDGWEVSLINFIIPNTSGPVIYGVSLVFVRSQWDHIQRRAQVIRQMHNDQVAIELVESSSSSAATKNNDNNNGHPPHRRRQVVIPSSSGIAISEINRHIKDYHRSMLSSSSSRISSNNDNDSIGITLISSRNVIPAMRSTLSKLYNTLSQELPTKTTTPHQHYNRPQRLAEPLITLLSILPSHQNNLLLPLILSPHLTPPLPLPSHLTLPAQRTTFHSTSILHLLHSLPPTPLALTLLTFLLERKIVITSQRRSLLLSTITAIPLLLTNPLPKTMHLVVPLVPSSLARDLVEYPAPYLLGIVSDDGRNTEVLNSLPEDVTLVDLDIGRVILARGVGNKPVHDSNNSGVGATTATSTTTAMKNHNNNNRRRELRSQMLHLADLWGGVIGVVLRRGMYCCDHPLSMGGMMMGEVEDGEEGMELVERLRGVCRELVKELLAGTNSCCFWIEEQRQQQQSSTTTTTIPSSSLSSSPTKGDQSSSSSHHATVIFDEDRFLRIKNLRSQGRYLPLLTDEEANVLYSCRRQRRRSSSSSRRRRGQQHNYDDNSSYISGGGGDSDSDSRLSDPSPFSLDVRDFDLILETFLRSQAMSTFVSSRPKRTMAFW